MPPAAVMRRHEFRSKADMPSGTQASRPLREPKSFRLRKRERLGAGVLRALRDEIAGAHGVLRQPLDETSTHALRRHLKRARAALRLLEPVLDGRCHEIRSRLRHAGQALSERRDADVMRALARDLADRAGGPAASVLRNFGEVPPAYLFGPDADAHAARATVSAVQAMLTDIEADHGWDAAVENQVERAEKRARRAWRAVSEESDDEALHRWRRRVKDCFYVARLLGKRSRFAEPGRVKSLDRLGEILGEDHDLAVLSAALGPPGESPDAGVVLARKLISRRRRKLRKKARAIARSVH